MVYAHKRFGFTLIEMLISVGIISAMVAVGTLVVGAMNASLDSAYENIAFRIANGKLDELRAGGYGALPASGQFDDVALAGLPQGSASTSVTVWNEETKKTTSGVSWLSVDGGTRFVSLTTLITQTGGL